MNSRSNEAYLLGFLNRFESLALFLPWSPCLIRADLSLHNLCCEYKRSFNIIQHFHDKPDCHVTVHANPVYLQF